MGMKPLVGPASVERRVSALLRRCCQGHCTSETGHACDRPPPYEMERLTKPGELDPKGPLHPGVEARLRELSGQPITHANAVRLLLDGTQSYTGMLVDRARDEILFENFIFRADAVGLGFAEELRRRANDGVEVRLLHDPLGSRLSSLHLARRFRDTPAQVRLFNPPRPTPASLRLGRDHRKLVIQDRTRMVVGGLCIADLWVGNCISRCTWRDSAILVEGESIAQAVGEFESMWWEGVPPSIRSRRSGESHAATRAPMESPGEVPVRVLADGPGRRCLEKILVEVFRSAREEIRVTNPYFVPTPSLVGALASAAQRGVNVELLLPGSSDHPVVDLATEHLLIDLLRAGVTVHSWAGPMIHAKTIVVDRHWSLIGSSNLDTFSLRRNAELNVEVHGTALGEQMAEVFRRDCEQSVPFTVREWESRSRRRRWITRVATLGRSWM